MSSRSFPRPVSRRFLSLRLLPVGALLTTPLWLPVPFPDWVRQTAPDEVWHLGFCAVLGLLGASVGLRLGRSPEWLLIGLTLSGFGLELLQLLPGPRTFDPGEGLLNALGMMLGFALACAARSLVARPSLPSRRAA